MTGAIRFEQHAAQMQPAADGRLSSVRAVLLPIMAPRLQADCDPDGVIELSVWGCGKLGKVRFEPLAGPFLYSPNQVVGTNGGVFVAQSAPAMLIRGRRVQRLFPARRCAWWHEVSRDAARPVVEQQGERRSIVLPWGAIVIEQRGDDLVLTAGESLAEAMSALRLSADQIVAEADAYIARCDLLPAADPLLRSMVVHGIHAALSSIRSDAEGKFAGLAAGQAYSAPARTYFRDGYWTLQPLLRLAPEAVREQLRLLAGGVQPDGEAPSGVILSGPAQSAAWRQFRDHPDRYKEHHLRPEDWWSDHFDSPLFFILAVGDYVRETGDAAEAALHWATVVAITERYFGLAGPDGLPRKPRHDRDWADNVFREGLVAYDLGLWVGALDVVAELGASLDPALAERAVAAADAARGEIETQLWVEARQWFADFRTPDGFVEDHLMIDSLTLSRYGAVSAEKAVRLLRSVEATLESRNNTEQPYGDWGVLCAYPPYKRPGDVRAKSAFAFRYHNGSDWPYWDGVYAEERLRRGLGGARYALTRWWEMCLANGWAGAVEYYSPPFGRGSLLQGWSALPAAVAVKYGLAALSEDISPQAAKAVS
ncbi:MAG: glycogen debranching protein [Devosia sp.]|nr:glycogen debranching protein [Devosia sp.]